MFLDKLGMTIPAQQQAEVVEPGYDPLKFHAIDQEYGHGNFLFSYVVEKDVLEVLHFI